MLTEKWLPSVIFLQIICIGNISIPLCTSSLVAIKAIGQSGVFMKLEIVRRCAMLVVLFISIFSFGTIEAIAWSYVVSAFIDTLIVSVSSKKYLNYGPLRMLGDVWKIFVASLLMFGAVYMVGLIALPAWALLMLQIAAGGVSYVALCSVFRIDCFIELLDKIVGRKEKTAVK